MFNIAGFHIPKQIAFKSGAAILEKLGWDHEGLKPLGAVNTLTVTTILQQQLKNANCHTFLL